LPVVGDRRGRAVACPIHPSFWCPARPSGPGFKCALHAASDPAG
jgi:hypothetical protein